jgi:hypothetical protein
MGNVTFFFIVRVPPAARPSEGGDRLRRAGAIDIGMQRRCVETGQEHPNEPGAPILDQASRHWQHEIAAGLHRSRGPCLPFMGFMHRRADIMP